VVKGVAGKVRVDHRRTAYLTTRLRRLDDGEMDGTVAG
jgi:hypothetical protein